MSNLTAEQLEKMHLARIWKIRGKFQSFTIVKDNYIGKLQLVKGKKDKLRKYNLDVIGTKKVNSCLQFNKANTILVYFDIVFIESNTGGYGFNSLRVIKMEIKTISIKAEKIEREKAKQLNLLEQDNYKSSLLDKRNEDF